MITGIALLAATSGYLPEAARFTSGLPARSHVRPSTLVMQEAHPAGYDPEMSGLSQGQTSGRPDGAHGTGFRFMPLETISKDSSPVILCIAGFYPGLTADQLLSPAALPFSRPGAWNYHMLTTEAPGGFVALPGSSLLDEAPNTVAVVCGSASLGIEFPDESEHEVVALINRSDGATLDPALFSPNNFYAFADETGAVHIRWIEAIPPGWRVIGKLIYTQLPFVKKPGALSGFAETSDEFEF